jgi:hypothetical protein
MCWLIMREFFFYYLLLVFSAVLGRVTRANLWYRGKS